MQGSCNTGPTKCTHWWCAVRKRWGWVGSSISAAPKFLVFGNFAEFCQLVGPLTDSGGGGGW